MEQKQFTTLLLIVFLGFLGISLPYLVFPAIFLNPEYSILAPGSPLSSQAMFLGITLAAYPLGQFIGSPILGALSDDFGRKRLLSASLLVASLSNLLTGLALEWHMLWGVIASRFLAGLMEGNIAIARAMASQLKGISKHTAFGRINAAASVAYLIGPLFGGILADNQLFEGETSATPFYAICVLFLVTSFFSMVILKGDAPNQFVSEKRIVRHVVERFNIIKRMKRLFINKRLQFLMLTSTFFTLAIDIFYEFGPVYLTEKWMLGPMDLTLYNGILCAGLAIGNGILPSYISSRYSNRKVILFAMGSFSLLLLGVVLTDYVLLMLLFFTLCGLAIGLGVTLLTVKISDSASESIQGEVMGTQLSLRVLGDAFICLLGGFLLILSPKIILVLAAFISAFTMAGYYAFVTNFRVSSNDSEFSDP